MAQPCSSATKPGTSKPCGDAATREDVTSTVLRALVSEAHRIFPAVGDRGVQQDVPTQNVYAIRWNGCGDLEVELRAALEEEMSSMLLQLVQTDSNIEHVSCLGDGESTACGLQETSSREPAAEGAPSPPPRAAAASAAAQLCELDLCQNEAACTDTWVDTTTQKQQEQQQRQQQQQSQQQHEENVCISEFESYLEGMRHESQRLRASLKNTKCDLHMTQEAHRKLQVALSEHPSPRQTGSPCKATVKGRQMCELESESAALRMDLTRLQEQLSSTALASESTQQDQQNLTRCRDDGWHGSAELTEDRSWLDDEVWAQLHKLQQRSWELRCQLDEAHGAGAESHQQHQQQPSQQQQQQQQQRPRQCAKQLAQLAMLDQPMGSSLGAVQGLQARTESLRTLFQSQRIPTPELVHTTWQLVWRLQHANQQWAELHSGSGSSGSMPGSWAEAISMADGAEARVRRMARRLQACRATT